MPGILVLANDTIGGEALLDAIRERAQADDDPRFFVVVPRVRPQHGNVVYDETVRAEAQIRIDLALAFMREEHIKGAGEVGDGDPFNAAMDAIHAYNLKEIIISTLPPGTSGWLKRDLIAALEDESGLPVTHVVVDLERDGLPFDVTLVLANQTVAGSELAERLEALAAEGPHRFIIVVPQDSGDGRAMQAARDRLAKLLASLAEHGIVAAGMIGHPDPYTAAMNAFEYFHLSQIVVSTLPENRSKWVEDKVEERVRDATGLPVEHVTAAEQVEA